MTHLDLAQQHDPDCVLALTIRTRIHLDRNQAPQALECIQCATDSASNNTEVQALLAQALHQNDKYGEAIENLKRLIEREPSNYHHWNNIGNAYRDLALIDDANRCYQQAAELNPADPAPFSNWITGLHYDPRANRDEISRIALDWQHRFAPAHPPARPTPADRRPDRQLRIGMISDGFRQHPVGKMIIRCLEHLKVVEFEFFAYTSNDTRDPLTARIEGMSAQWLPIQHLPDDALAQRIRDDNIDILFDLSGHNSGSRMQAIALEPAPLIVKWVGGLINTTGVTAIDYLLSDTIQTPAGEDAFYSEKLIRMPNDYIVFDPPAYTPKIRDLPASVNGYVTFGCFNNPTKLNEVTLGEWAKILQAKSDSKLMLKGRAYVHPEFRDQVYASFEANGIGRERLILEGPGDNGEMLEAYNRVDIALDPWPYSGGLTTCESFLMGVPVVTLPGPTFAGRHSATHLINAGMPELVVTSWDDYRARVIELAEDLDNLATIRRLLRDVLLRSPVCDGEQFARHFTTAMRAIWQRYCREQAPAPLTIDLEGKAWFADQADAEILQHPTSETDDSFEWQFDGKIIAVDSGARSINVQATLDMLAQGALELVLFDPASKARNKPAIQRESVHYYPNIGLGDGRTGNLHACIDPELTSSLQPLIREDANENDAQVIAKLPLNTIALDDIDGLPRVDWLTLDELNDSKAILDHGRHALASTLIIQVRVTFQPTHANQPNFGDLQSWATRNGFRFFRFVDPLHRSYLPEPFAEARQHHTSELVSANALLLPTQPRLKTLSDNQRVKLAFLLHHVYEIYDLAYWLLSETGAALADHYWQDLHKNASEITRFEGQSCHSAHSNGIGDESISREIDQLLN
ncbi:TPR domain protein, putative component of TonB system [Salinisphaera sp. LB1]|nr:TPR domain protein, putative component of TonB system [Salinisphaera sp. LB1]